MTHDTIEQLIDALNCGEMRDRVFLAHLSAQVDFAKVWLEEPRGGIGFEESYNFFFVKNEQGIYVGAVLDMGNDLHILVKEAFRGEGHLTKAIHETILPKLYQSGRKKQRITFENPEILDYCVRNWGFSPTGDLEAEKDLSTYSHVQKISLYKEGITWEEFSDIRVKLDRARLYLCMVQQQLELSFGDCEGLYIEELQQDISSLADQIEDLIESKNSDKQPGQTQ